MRIKSTCRNLRVIDFITHKNGKIWKTRIFASSEWLNRALEMADEKKKEKRITYNNNNRKN